MGEFDLIARHFTRAVRRAALGVGDDCALLAPAPGQQWAVSSDMLVAGRHFFADVAPEALGHKALAVNLSDLAACGAKPRAFTLALALPQADDAWLAAFARGLLALADAHGCELIGGDTTAGPLNLCITVMGEVPPGDALRRSGAQPGDDVWVSGTLGDARLALQALLGQRQLPAAVLAQARQRLEWPSPRVALGLALRGLAHSAIDLSDGLIGDLGHILEQSGVGATLDADVAANLIAAYASRTGVIGDFSAQTSAPPAACAEPPWALSLAERRALVLCGGDDYELLFTAAPAQREAVAQVGQRVGVMLTRIGQIDAQPGLRLHTASGAALDPKGFASFDHFA